MSINRKRELEASDDDDEYDEDYKGKGRLHDALLRKIGMLCQRRIEYKRIVTRLKINLRLLNVESATMAFLLPLRLD